MNDEEAAPAPAFATLEDFVQWICEVYRRQVNGVTHVWNGEWWKSTEVVMRMDAMWRAFEALRLDPGTGLSSWWRDHADYHMSVILSPDGPLYYYTEESPLTRAKYNDQLPFVPLPADMT